MTQTRSRDYDEATDATKPAAPAEEVDMLPNQARQGVTHHNVLTVLILSLTGCVVLMVVAYLAFFA